MSNQLRILFVAIGGILVVVTYTFPLWQPYLGLLPGRGETAFLGLDERLTEQIAQLPPQQIVALRELADEEPDLARDIAIAQLSPTRFVDDDVPTEIGQRRAIVGEFTTDADVLQVEGTITIYEIADGSHILRIDELNVTNLPDMNVYITGTIAPENREELEQGGNFHRLDTLRGNAGNQNYAIAPEIDLSSYNSVVIYSETLELVVGYAYFQIRL